MLQEHATLTDSGGENHAFRPGTMFLCPPGVEGLHAFENTSDFPMTLLFIYPTQDYETVRLPFAWRKTPQQIVLRNIEEIALEPQRSPHVRTKRLCDSKNAEHLISGVMWWDPGSRLDGIQPHYHSIEEFQLVVYGKSTLKDSNGAKHPLQEGVMFHCPPGIGGVHGIENTSDFPMCLPFAYPRQEFETTPYLND